MEREPGILIDDSSLIYEEAGRISHLAELKRQSISLDGVDPKALFMKRTRNEKEYIMSLYFRGSDCEILISNTYIDLNTIDARTIISDECIAKYTE